METPVNDVLPVLPLLPAPNHGMIEQTVIHVVEWLRLSVETVGAAVIAMGVVVAIIAFVRELRRSEGRNFNQVRLTLARYLALALEFQLGADILSTAIAPSWDQIGKLGAIAVIRTALNFFLMREMHHEQRGNPPPETNAVEGGAAGAESRR